MAVREREREGNESGGGCMIFPYKYFICDKF